ncbi:MAG: recombinase family protein [Bacteroidota bacterium]|nr:recombinase family protein [Bacteroidota bacterium]
MKATVAIFGRVSSDQQDFQRQINDLQKVAAKLNYDVVTVITEKISGAKTNEERRGVQQLLDGARKGLFKKVMVTEVSRLGRSTIETLKLIEELHKLGVSIYLQDLNAETLNEKGETSFQTEIMLHMLSLFSKNERRNLISRIRSGMQTAKANQVHCGRPLGTVEQKEEFLSKYPKVVEGLKKGFSVRECVKLYDTSLATVAKIRKILYADSQQLAA